MPGLAGPAASPPTSSTACCARRRPLDEQLDGAERIPGSRARSPTATARWRGSSSRRCCAGSARCGTCCGSCSNAACRPTRRGSRPRCSIGAAQILFLDVPDHAAVDLVGAARARPTGAPRSYAGLVNAVLRRLAREGAQRLARARSGARSIRRTGCWQRWTAHLRRATTARAIATAHGHEPALDLTVKARRRALGGASSAGACCRPARCAHVAQGPVSQLPGYADGAWWVQDAAAALAGAAARRRRAARRVADLCAAPGGKTAQLAAAGARVTAVDRSAAPARAAARRTSRGSGSPPRSSRPTRLEWQAGPFDAVLLDAPCSSTGTIRRHPDIPWLKRPSGHRRPRRACSAALIDRAAALMLKPGGTLVYCTCSLEPEEGSRSCGAARARAAAIRRRPIAPGESTFPAELLNADGDLRTLPCHSPIPTRDGRARRLLRRPAGAGVIRRPVHWDAVTRPAVEVTAGGWTGTRRSLWWTRPAMRGAKPRMSRASVAERAGLSVILARRLFGSLVGRVTTNPIVSWSLSSASPIGW